MMLGLDLPELLDAEAVFAPFAAIGEAEFLDQLLGERTARALRDQHVLAHQGHAGGEGGAVRPVALDSHVAGDDAGDRALLVVDEAGGGKAG